METPIDEILKLVKKKMIEQGAFTRAAYEEFVDETIVFFRERGKLTDEDSDRFIKDQLLEMWETVQEEFSEK